MEQLLKAIRKYDPEYIDKVRLVTETINEKLSLYKQIALADLGRYLDFDPLGHVRMLVRRGHLETVAGPGGKIVAYERVKDSWPPPAALLASGSIGITYYIQTWFRYYPHFLADLDRPPEGLEIVGRGLRELIQLPQQVLRTFKAHAQAAGVELNTSGQGGQIRLPPRGFDR